MADAEKKVVKTYTEEEVQTNFVPKQDFDNLYKEYEKIVTAFNRLMKSYNELHLKYLIPQEDTTK